MIVGQPREPLWAFLNTRTGVEWSEDLRTLGLVKNGCLMAVIGYNGFVGRACFMHSAIDHPSVMTRTFFQAIFEYPFVQCNLTHVLATVESTNSRALRLNSKCGFKEVLRLEGASIDGGDIIVMQLKREECRFLGDRYGEEKPEGAGLQGCSGDRSSGEQSPDPRADLRESARVDDSVGHAVLDEQASH